MTQYIVVFIFFFIAMAIMLASLQFSKYKQKPGSCAGDSCSSCSSASLIDANACTKVKEFEEKIMIDTKKLNV